jgi:lipopolysaccharide/colanic/teichoic acid biosynthesis glycosyltransferase
MEYAKVITEFYARHNVKPGITGWAQVNGLRGETDTEEKMRRRVALDLHYIESWSLLMDIKIIIMTAVTVWFQDTAY